MIDFEVAREKLLQFEEPEEIAEFLIHQGVKGSRALSSSCAVANWMTEVTGTPTFVNQNEMWRSFDVYKLYHHNGALGEFVRRFDEGRYPDLIANEYDATICRNGILNSTYYPYTTGE